MDILDIHTHNQPANPFQAIVNCSPSSFSPKEGYYSVGYHPWYLSPDGAENWELLNELAANPQVLAIGEAGLDKLKGAEMPVQEKAFEKQALLAEDCRKPLIIHAVRTYNEILHYKKEIKPQSAWIIHGFRGKKELALQLISHGFYLSFGEKYQEDALKATPIDRLFLETDESKTDIYTLYEKASSLLSLPTQSLIEAVQQNISNVFFK